MKLHYSLRLIEDVDVAPGVATGEVEVGGVVVQWGVDGSKLKSLDLFVCGVEPKTDQFDALVPPLPGCDVKRVAEYVANYLFVQTNQDAVELTDFSPRMLPETPEEEALFARHRQLVSLVFEQPINHIKYFNPLSLSAGWRDSEAYADFGDGLRVNHSNSKIILFYRVLEWFSKKQDNVQASSFAKYLSKFDSIFHRDKLENLKGTADQIGFSAIQLA